MIYGNALNSGDRSVPNRDKMILSGGNRAKKPVVAGRFYKSFSVTPGMFCAAICSSTCVAPI